MKYKFEINKKLVDINLLLKYYNKEKVEGYCLNCPSYNKNLSCPPHSFNELDYLKKYKYVYIVSGKVVIDKSKVKETDIDTTEIFEEARREFSDLLIKEELNHFDSKALIAGKCYRCEICTKADGEVCLFKNKIRYSLESLGLMVSELTKDVTVHTH